MDTVNARLDVTARKRRQGVTSVDGDGTVLRLHPFPVALRIQDLQGCDGLAEEQCQGS